ncbi:hypothetical protein CDAR_219351 [Caerostris darwini]|uniref:Uncharacterized protein n=1 Tax=Caerostris darwini TaxID=1538125 RepID=A0AAV4PKN8_9ARAC|nr:hypothetical protein CDAR_219351 [Caerostris darwini]
MDDTTTSINHLQHLVISYPAREVIPFSYERFFLPILSCWTENKILSVPHNSQTSSIPSLSSEQYALVCQSDCPRYAAQDGVCKSIVNKTYSSRLTYWSSRTTLQWSCVLIPTAVDKHR